MEFLEQDYPELTTRQEQLDKCYETAAFYQQQLDAFEGALEDKMALGGQMVTALDAIFPMCDETVWLNGWALVPLADDEGTVVGDGFSQTDGYGKHRGFDTVIWEDEQGVQHMKLMHQILIGETNEDLFKTVGRQTRFYKFFDLSAAVFSLEEMEETLLTGRNGENQMPDNVCDVVEGQSRRLVNLLRSTTFRRLSHRQQKKQVDNFVVQAEDMARIRDMQIIAEPFYAYAPLVGSTTTRHFVALDLSRVIIKGKCVGLDALVSVELNRHAIRRNADSSFLHDGLSYVIDPDQDTRTGLNLSDEQVLYVPTQTQTFNAELYRE